ncbi:Myeloid leukemia factor-like protein, partial [Euroglyphus maynei]
MDNMMNSMMGGMFDPFALTPFGRPGQNMMMSPFNPMNQFQNMFQQASQMQANPGTSSYVSSSFVSYSSNGNQPPQIYEETKMNHVGPGGVREERHTVRDSRSGVQKMKVGRHIQDRGHVMERSRNNYTGDEEENNEFINIEEEEAPQFQQEWSSRMSQGYQHPPNGQQYLQQAPNRTRLAITGPSDQSSVSPVPIITHPPNSTPPPISTTISTNG